MLIGACNFEEVEIKGDPGSVSPSVLGFKMSDAVVETTVDMPGPSMTWC